MPTENLKRVFDRMYRLEQRLAQDPGGFVLGLASCKALIEAHGGRIWVNIILFQMSNLFKKSHRIGVDIVSSKSGRALVLVPPPVNT